MCLGLIDGLLDFGDDLDYDPDRSDLHAFFTRANPYSFEDDPYYDQHPHYYINIGGGLQSLTDSLSSYFQYKL